MGGEMVRSLEKGGRLGRVLLTYISFTGRPGDGG